MAWTDDTVFGVGPPRFELSGGLVLTLPAYTQVRGRFTPVWADSRPMVINGSDAGERLGEFQGFELEWTISVPSGDDETWRQFAAVNNAVLAEGQTATFYPWASPGDFAVSVLPQDPVPMRAPGDRFPAGLDISQVWVSESLLAEIPQPSTPSTSGTTLTVSGGTAGEVAGHGPAILIYEQSIGPDRWGALTQPTLRQLKQTPIYLSNPKRMLTGSLLGAIRRRFIGYRTRWTLTLPVAGKNDWLLLSNVYNRWLVEGLTVTLRPFESTSIYDVQVEPVGPLELAAVGGRKPAGLEVSVDLESVRAMSSVPKPELYWAAEFGIGVGP